MLDAFSGWARGNYRSIRQYWGIEGVRGQPTACQPERLGSGAGSGSVGRGIDFQDVANVA